MVRDIYILFNWELAVYLYRMLTINQAAFSQISRPWSAGFGVFNLSPKLYPLFQPRPFHTCLAITLYTL
jgi:hypothetical protein